MGEVDIYVEGSVTTLLLTLRFICSPERTGAPHTKPDTGAFVNEVNFLRGSSVT